MGSHVLLKPILLSADHHPAVHVVLLPTLESVLYGPNISDILTHFSVGLLLCQYRRQSQKGGQKMAQHSTRLSRYARPRCRCLLAESSNQVLVPKGNDGHPFSSDNIQLESTQVRRQTFLSVIGASIMDSGYSKKYSMKSTLPLMMK
ncbi:hypothetical protein EV424DRAFT_177613 [Suillus variegatus]|nr:hypothetical protein EV424DRAFT_177613 [Suillus variegatus]